jgi:dienelactone hydrolase
VSYLQHRDDVDPARIGGIGLSVGGELMLQAAAESDGLRAVVSEGAGIRSIREARSDRIGIAQLLFAGPVISMATISTAVFTNGLPPKSLQELVPDIEVPVFYIYAKQGHGGEVLSEDYYDLATGPKQLWQIDGPHIRGIEAEAAEYERRVIAFYDNALPHP